MSLRRSLYGFTLPCLLCVGAGCSGDREARSARDEQQYTAGSTTTMTPASRPMAEEERSRAPETPSYPSVPSGIGAAASMDCPVDVADTDVAVMSEGEGISMVFRLEDPGDAAALEALRTRVRGLAERYRNERMATMGSAASPNSQQSSSMNPHPPMGTQDAPAQPGMGTPEGTPAPATIGAIAVTVQDTEDGAKIIVGSTDGATLDVLRARLAQDAQIMTQTGSCPW